ncbi:MAG: thioesterase family protein [Burkholderiales bacterium]
MSNPPTDLAHPFDQALALEPLGDHRWQGHTSPAYANMVGPFGGLTAAQALAGVLRHSECLGDPVALTVNFAAALASGPFEVIARPARTNRSTQHWVVEMQQSGQTVLTATVVTAVRRQTWSADALPMPKVPAPNDTPRTFREAPVEWIKRYEMRFLEGHFPTAWDGREGGSRTRLWLRDDPPRGIDFASLAALADVFYPLIWQRRALRVPIGTVSMTTYFHATAAELAAVAGGFILGEARASAFRNGYFDQTAHLWSEAGALLASTHQLVYYKE